jgi:PHD/YefM family antitoxin component YafN of YafNO toxin-antitoxin module
MLDLGLDIKVVKLEDTKDNVKNTPLRLIITLKNWTNAIYLDIFGW